MSYEFEKQLKISRISVICVPLRLIGKYLKTVIDFYNYLCKTKKPFRQNQNGCMVCKNDSLLDKWLTPLCRRNSMKQKHLV